MSSHEVYENPLIGRYSSRAMQELWGAQRRFSTWRQLWVWLAEAEQELGLGITDSQIRELRAHLHDIDFVAAARHERELRHDVMAHVHAYGDVCPEARPIIHLGATSCYVTDNTDLLLMREALGMIAQRLAAVIDQLATFAARYRDLPCLGFTHLQPAQPTTVGKRACLWAYDLTLDLDRSQVRRDEAILNLTPTEFKLLVFLARHPGQALSREQILTAVWGYNADVDSERAVNVHISRLRDKVERDPSRPALILTVPSIGYRLVG